MPSQRYRVLILGHGAMGRSMETLLGPRHELEIWDRNLETWEENIPLEEAARERDAVLFTLPAKPHAELAERIRPQLAADCICLTIAKGLDDSARTPAEIFTEYLGGTVPWGVLYGPMIARELQAGRPGFALLASRAARCLERGRELFAGSPLYLDASDDVIGASWSVILKNVYVPLIGAADGLELGDNMRGFLVAEILAEIDCIAAELGGRPGTAYSLAGLGDLVTTATSASSHHRRIGADLAAGRTDRMGASGANIRGEGIHTIRVLQERHRLDADTFPLLRLMRSVLETPDRIPALLQRHLAERFART